MLSRPLLFLCLCGAHFQQSTRIYGTPLHPAVHAYYLRPCGLHPFPAWERAESVSAACAGWRNHPIPELPEGPKSPLYFTALAQYGPDVPAVRFRAAGRPFLGRGAGERPHAARSGAAGVIRLSERHIQSRIPDAAGRHCAGSGT